MARHARMAAAGIRVLHFSPAQIRTEPDLVARTIKSALEAAELAPGLRTGESARRTDRLRRPARPTPTPT